MWVNCQKDGNRQNVKYWFAADIWGKKGKDFYELFHLGTSSSVTGLCIMRLVPSVIGLVRVPSRAPVTICVVMPVSVRPLVHIGVSMPRVCKSVFVLLHLVLLHRQHGSISVASQESLSSVEIWGRFSSPGRRLWDLGAITPDPVKNHTSNKKKSHLTQPSGRLTVNSVSMEGFVTQAEIVPIGARFMAEKLRFSAAMSSMFWSM